MSDTFLELRLVPLRCDIICRNTEKPIQDYAKDGRKLYKAMYGDNADNVQNLLDNIYPDMGKHKSVGSHYGISWRHVQAGSPILLATA